MGDRSCFARNGSPTAWSSFIATCLNVAGECVAILRWAAGRDVRFHDTGVKQFHHPVVGELSLSYNRLDLPADHGLTIFTCTAEPGSRSEEALKLLGSWAASADLAESPRALDQT